MCGYGMAASMPTGDIERSSRSKEKAAEGGSQFKPELFRQGADQGLFPSA
jgi:hypothetical protein